MDEKSELKFKNFLQSFNAAKTVYGDVLQDLRNHVIPESYAKFKKGDFSPSELEDSSLIFRNEFLMASGYALVAYDWVRPLAQWVGDRRCLEVMCGCGCLAKALKDCGTNIIATDDFSWQNHEECWFRNPWTDIEQLDAVSAIQKYGQDTDIFIMSWPYRDNAAYQALLEMRKQNPQGKLIFIGEWRGMTADEKFFDAAEILNDASFYETIKAYRQFPTIHDRPMLLC